MGWFAKLFTILWVLLVVAPFSSCLGQKRPAGCAPFTDVSKALQKAQVLVARELGPDEAAELLAILKQKGIVIGGMVCFLSGDFAEFGHILAYFFASHQKESKIETTERRVDDGWRPTFNNGDQDDTIAANDCLCPKCPAGHESWCAVSLSEAKCCPHICANIFSTISVGALIGLKSSGVDSCCEDGAARCASNQRRNTPQSPQTQHPRGTVNNFRPPPSNWDPDFNFGGNTEPTVTNAALTSSSLGDESAEISISAPAAAPTAAEPSRSLSPSPSSVPTLGVSGTDSPTSISPHQPRATSSKIKVASTPTTVYTATPSASPRQRRHEVIFSVTDTDGNIILTSNGLPVGTAPKSSTPTISGSPSTTSTGKHPTADSVSSAAFPPSQNPSLSSFGTSSVPVNSNSSTSNIAKGSMAPSSLATKNRPTATPSMTSRPIGPTSSSNLSPEEFREQEPLVSGTDEKIDPPSTASESDQMSSSTPVQEAPNQQVADPLKDPTGKYPRSAQGNLLTSSDGLEPLDSSFDLATPITTGSEEDAVHPFLIDSESSSPLLTADGPNVANAPNTGPAATQKVLPSPLLSPSPLAQSPEDDFDTNASPASTLTPFE